MTGLHIVLHTALPLPSLPFKTRLDLPYLTHRIGNPSDFVRQVSGHVPKIGCKFSQTPGRATDSSDSVGIQSDTGQLLIHSAITSISEGEKHVEII